MSPNKAQVNIRKMELYLAAHPVTRLKEVYIESGCKDGADISEQKREEEHQG